MTLLQKSCKTHVCGWKIHSNGKFLSFTKNTLVVDLHIEKLHSIQATAFVGVNKTPIDSNTDFFGLRLKYYLAITLNVVKVLVKNLWDYYELAD